jgi:GT2 family glycosyltransferase
MFVSDRGFIKADGEYEEMPGDLPPALTQSLLTPNGFTYSSEDFDFCWRARKLGYKIALNTDLVVGHLQMIDLAHFFQAAGKAAYRSHMRSSMEVA